MLTSSHFLLTTFSRQLCSHYNHLKKVIKRNNNSWLKSIIQKDSELSKKTDIPEEKELLVISFNSPDDKVEDAICIPLTEMKAVTGQEVDDDTLISISKKLNELNMKKKI